MTFETWEEAHAHAVKTANEYQMPVGVEHSPIGGYWFTRYTPKDPAKRFGCDLRCEVVEPTIWAPPA